MKDDSVGYLPNTWYNQSEATFHSVLNLSVYYDLATLQCATVLCIATSVVARRKITEAQTNNFAHKFALG